MKDKSTGFSGFLDGYKARNIAASASSMMYHFEEMRSALDDILASQRSKGAPPELTQLLSELFSRVSQALSLLSARQEEFLSVAVSCGEILRKIRLMSKQSGDATGLLAEEKMRPLVYHYLEFAELSGDKSITDLAISIAEIF